MSAILQFWALGATDGTSAPSFYYNGLPFESDGSLAVEIDGTASIDHYHQGLPFSANNRILCVEQDPNYYGYGEIRFGILAIVGDAQSFRACHSMRIRGSTSINEPNLPVAITAYNGATESDFEVYVGGRQYSIIGKYVPKFRTTGQERWGVSTSTTSTPLASLRVKTGLENRSIKLDYVFGAATAEDHILEVYIGTGLTGAFWATPTNATAAETALEADVSATAFSNGLLTWSQPVLAGGWTKVTGDCLTGRACIA